MKREQLECMGGPLDGKKIASAMEDFYVPSRAASDNVFKLSAEPSSKPEGLIRHHYRRHQYKTAHADHTGFTVETVWRYIGVE